MKGIGMRIPNSEEIVDCYKFYAEIAVNENPFIKSTGLSAEQFYKSSLKPLTDPSITNRIALMIFNQEDNQILTYICSIGNCTLF